jgi:hypothetical protein
MELVPVVGVVVAAAIAALVCVRRAKLGEEMDRFARGAEVNPGTDVGRLHAQGAGKTVSSQVPLAS